MISRTASLLFASMTVLLAGGCAETPTERDFGNAVRHVVWQQIHDPAAGRTAGSTAVTGADPAKLQEVMEVYRGETVDQGGNTQALRSEAASSR